MRRRGDALFLLSLFLRSVPPLSAAALLLAGCASEPASRVGPGAPSTSLTRAQALSPEAVGARVLWYGGVASVQARDDGRDCFTLRYGRTDEQGRLQWPRDARALHPVVACGPGRYPRRLVEPFTVLRVQGRVVGQAVVWGVAAPVLEIESVYRQSDCLDGETDFVAHPTCRSGLLTPQ